jgi:hypothetical protein
MEKIIRQLISETLIKLPILAYKLERKVTLKMDPSSQ